MTNEEAIKELEWILARVNILYVNEINRKDDTFSKEEIRQYRVEIVDVRDRLLYLHQERTYKTSRCMMTNEEAIEGIYNLMGLVTILQMKGKLPREITEDVVNEYRAAVQHAVMILKRD